ncbi:hypothetical protein F5144DRAFT_575986 [Chaetomium tenue]|uniref:Uncharacterized protein n=1 Tax=Chaetomium tenue TaxID=1854479 RepID=A0ACB7P146_9PEZI|nr:hypothetical protein F5144DRAFT_575986 [Chaetomium globosum]
MSFSTYPLDKRTRQDMIVYLENANPDQLSASAWGQTTWQAAHGEGRSASSTTFHIGLRFAQGHYWTCILTRVRRQEVALEGTIIDWGTTAPNLPGVLREYQRQFIRARAPASENPQRDPTDNNGGGSGGGGGGGGGGNDNGPAWEKKVLKDDYGGYYYMDENDEYCACDAQGTQLKTTTLKGRTTNPHAILLVFVNSQRQTYFLHKGQRIPCQVQKDPSTHHPFILDDKQKKRNVQVYGPMPRWKAARAQAPAQPSGKISSSKTTPSSKVSSSKTPAQAPAASAKVSTRQPLQAVQYMVDPASGRKYYMGADGKPHWA